MERQEQTKTARAKQLYLSGDFKGALAIFRSFRIGFTRDEHRMMEISHEALGGHADFYKSIWIDTDKMIETCRLMLQNKYF